MKKIISIAVALAAFAPTLAAACMEPAMNSSYDTSVMCAELDCARNKWNVKTSPRSIKQSAKKTWESSQSGWTRYPTLHWPPAPTK